MKIGKRIEALKAGKTLAIKWWCWTYFYKNTPMGISKWLYHADDFPVFALKADDYLFNETLDCKIVI